MKSETTWQVAIYAIGGVALGASLFALGMCSGAKAEPAQIPARYRGEWCDHASGNYYTRYNPRVCKRGGIGYMRITAAGYVHEMEDVERCRVVSVKADACPKCTSHVIKLTCDIDGAEGPQSLTSWFAIQPPAPGYAIRLYVEPLDSDQP